MVGVTRPPTPSALDVPFSTASPTIFFMVATGWAMGIGRIGGAVHRTGTTVSSTGVLILALLYERTGAVAMLALSGGGQRAFQRGTKVSGSHLIQAGAIDLSCAIALETNGVGGGGGGDGGGGGVVLGDVLGVGGTTGAGVVVPVVAGGVESRGSGVITNRSGVIINRSGIIINGVVINRFLPLRGSRCGVDVVHFTVFV